MAEYVHLIGTEQVQSAANTIMSAADVGNLIAYYHFKSSAYRGD